MMSRPAEHHAKLTVHHLNIMAQPLKERLATWLEGQAKIIRETEGKTYSSVYTARLMK